MDPDANLAEQHALATTIIERQDADTTVHPADAELIVALDGWLRARGWLPARWAGPSGA